MVFTFLSLKNELFWFKFHSKLVLVWSFRLWSFICMRHLLSSENKGFSFVKKQTAKNHRELESRSLTVSLQSCLIRPHERCVIAVDWCTYWKNRQLKNTCDRFMAHCSGCDHSAGFSFIASDCLNSVSAEAVIAARTVWRSVISSWPSSHDTKLAQCHLPPMSCLLSKVNLFLALHSKKFGRRM